MVHNLNIYSTVLGVVLLFTGCGAPMPQAAPEGVATISSVATPEPTQTPTAAPSPNPEKKENLIEKIETVYNQLDSSRLPTDKTNLRLYDELDSEGLPPQLLHDTPEAYRLSQAVRNLMDSPTTIGLRDFDLFENAHMPSLLQTALYHTQPIIFGIETSDTDRFKFTPKNHRLGLLAEWESESGRSPSELFYEDDVFETAEYLFGKLPECAASAVEKPYYYYGREQVFSRVGDYGGPWWKYPQIVSYAQTDSGYSCEAVLVLALDEDEPQHGDSNDIPLSADNFDEQTQTLSRYRFTFREADDDSHLIVTSLATLTPEDIARECELAASASSDAASAGQPQSTDDAQPISDDAPQSSQERAASGQPAVSQQGGASDSDQTMQSHTQADTKFELCVL